MTTEPTEDQQKIEETGKLLQTTHLNGQWSEAAFYERYSNLIGTYGYLI